jgi:hypothetical protein
MPSPKPWDNARKYREGQAAIATLVRIGIPHAAIFPVQRRVEEIGARLANAAVMKAGARTPAPRTESAPPAEAVQ